MKNFGSGLALILVLGTLTACTGSSNVARVEFVVAGPDAAKALGASRSAQQVVGNVANVGSNGLHLPTVGYCFGMHVYGPGLFAAGVEPKASCSSGPGGLGKVYGPRAYGQELILEVPVGPARSFDMVAFDVVALGLGLAHDCTGQIHATPRGANEPTLIEYHYQGNVYDLSENDDGDSALLFMARGKADLVAGSNRVPLSPASGLQQALYSGYSCSEAPAEGNAPSRPVVTSSLGPISNSSVANFNVSPVALGDTVALYSNPTCSGAPLVSTATASAPSVDLMLSGLSDGTINVYAKVTRGTLVSPCSAAVSYTRDSVVPTVSFNSGSSDPVSSAFSVSLAFDGPVLSLSVGSITVSNGTVTSLTNPTSDQQNFVAQIQPTAQGLVSLHLTAGSVTDLAGNPIATTPNFTRIFDSVAPTVQQITSTAGDGTYGGGQIIEIDVHFNETVGFAGGTPQLVLSTGVNAYYLSGNSSAVHRFAYSVGSGEHSDDLDALSIMTMGATYTDGAANAADLNLPPNYLASTRNIAVHAHVNFSVMAPYAAHANWNDYVRYTDPNMSSYQQIENTCGGSESGYYGEVDGCLHSGQMRFATMPAGTMTCEQLAVTDLLDVFNWSCEPIGGTLHFRTQGFKPGRGLADLLQDTGTIVWKANQLRVRRIVGNVLYAESIPQAWWDDTGNPIVRLTNNAGITVLNGVNTIYAASGPIDVLGLRVIVNKVAIVTLPGAEIRYSSSNTYNMDEDCTDLFSGNASRLICASNLKHLWVEGSFAGYLPSPSLSKIIGIDTMAFSRFRNLNLQASNNTTDALIAIRESDSNLFEGGFADNMKNGVLRVDLSSKNIFRNFKMSRGISLSGDVKMVNLSSSLSNRLEDIDIANVQGGSAAGFGVFLGAGSDDNVITGLKIASVQGTAFASGLHIESSYNVVQGVLITGIDGSGISLSALTGDVENNVITQSTLASNSAYGVLFKRAASTYGFLDNYLANLIVVNTAMGIGVSGGALGPSDNNRLRDLAVEGTTSSILKLDASFSLSGYLLRDATEICDTTQGGPFAVNCAGGGGNLQNRSDIANAFLGAVPSDAVNISDASGLAPIATVTSSSFDWLSFANPFRSWGRYAANLISGTGFGACYGDTNGCRIWDWRLKVSDPVLMNRGFDGSGSNPSFTGGTPCPTVIDGNQTADTTTSTFLRHAFEDMKSKRGNKNGLCEEDEDCIYSPQIGAFPGEGQLESCVYQPNGGLSGISIRGHAQPFGS